MEIKVSKILSSHTELIWCASQSGAAAKADSARFELRAASKVENEVKLLTLCEHGQACPPQSHPGDHFHHQLL